MSIRFRALTDVEWDKVIAALADQAIYAAKLLNGEMPGQIEEVFQAAGARLFPAQAVDLLTECSCPDYANPCKHVAAVHYLLGEHFDADPFLIFLHCWAARSNQSAVEPKPSTHRNYQGVGPSAGPPRRRSPPLLTTACRRTSARFLRSPT